MNILEEAEAMVELYIEAEKQILNGQSYKIGSRELTRADLNAVVKFRKEWEKKVSDLKDPRGKRPRIKRALIRDL